MFDKHPAGANIGSSPTVPNYIGARYTLLGQHYWMIATKNRCQIRYSVDSGECTREESAALYHENVPARSEWGRTELLSLISATNVIKLKVP